jgi:hypothetical protein
MNDKKKLGPKPRCRVAKKKQEEKVVQPRKARVSSKSSDDGLSIKSVKEPIIRNARVSSASSGPPEPVQ